MIVKRKVADAWQYRFETVYVIVYGPPTVEAFKSISPVVAFTNTIPAGALNVPPAVATELGNTVPDPEQYVDCAKENEGLGAVSMKI